jgi:hypothetical protein
MMIAACSMSKPAAPSGPPPSGTIGEKAISTTATVQKIDHKQRKVTLKRADGTMTTIQVGESVQNLPQVKVGDEVTVTYYESLAYEVKKPGQAEPGAAVGEQVERAKPGEKPAGAVAQVAQITATITAIDKKAGTVTLRGADGESTTIKARNPANLERVAVGDLVEITYTEALAIAVEPPAKK